MAVFLILGVDILAPKSSHVTKIKGAGENMGFLEQLYDKGYFPCEDLLPEPTEEYRQAKERLAELYKQIATKLNGEALLEEFLATKADAVSIEMATAFAEGARSEGKVFLDCCRK